MPDGKATSSREAVFCKILLILGVILHHALAEIPHGRICAFLLGKLPELDFRHVPLLSLLREGIIGGRLRVRLIGGAVDAASFSGPRGWGLYCAKAGPAPNTNANAATPVMKLNLLCLFAIVGLPPWAVPGSSLGAGARRNHRVMRVKSGAKCFKMRRDAGDSGDGFVFHH